MKEEEEGRDEKKGGQGALTAAADPPKTMPTSADDREQWAQGAFGRREEAAMQQSHKHWPPGWQSQTCLVALRNTKWVGPVGCRGGGRGERDLSSHNPFKSDRLADRHTQQSMSSTRLGATTREHCSAPCLKINSDKLDNDAIAMGSASRVGAGRAPLRLFRSAHVKRTMHELGPPPPLP